MARFRGGVSGAAGGRNRLRPRPAGGGPQVQTLPDVAGPGAQNMMAVGGEGPPGGFPQGREPVDGRIAAMEGAGGGRRSRAAQGPAVAETLEDGPAWQKLGFGDRGEAAQAMREAEGGGAKNLRQFIRQRLAAQQGDEMSPDAVARPGARPEPGVQTLPDMAGPETGAGSPASLATRPAPAAQPPGFGTGELRTRPFYPEPAPDGDVKPFIPPGLQGGPAGPQPSFRQPSPEAIRPILQRLMAGRGGAGDFAGGGRERQPLTF